MQHDRCYSLGHFQSLPHTWAAVEAGDTAAACWLCVLQFALIHVIMLKLQLPAALPLHAEQVFDNIWSLRDQTHIFIGWNRYCPFMVVVFNIDIICVRLQEFSATIPNH